MNRRQSASIRDMSTEPGFAVRVLSPSELARRMTDFVDILVDTVDNGAAVGFFPPLDQRQASDYWAGVKSVLDAGGRVLLCAERNGALLQIREMATCAKCSSVSARNGGFSTDV